MKKFLLISNLIIWFSVSSSFAQIKNSTTIETIEPGIIHKHIIDKNDTLSIHVVTIDLKNNSYSVVAVKAADSLLGRETTSSMAKRFNEKNGKVIAAINTDFFKIKYSGEPENILIINGEFVKGINLTDSEYDTIDNIHSQFAITKDKVPFIERFHFYGEIMKGNKKFRVNRINAQTDSATITLYNHHQGYATPNEKENWNNLEIRLEKLFTFNDTLFYRVTNDWYKKGRTRITSDDFILSTNNELANEVESSLKVGDTLKILLGLLPNVGKIYTSTGGWGKIVNAGKIFVDSCVIKEGIFQKFSETKHPRSGIGFSKEKDKLYLFTVDGRQELSKGVSLKKFAEIMLSEGVYEGLNFDGGGSTTLVINNKIVNSPSDKTGERAVGVALLIIKNN